LIGGASIVLANLPTFLVSRSLYYLMRAVPLAFGPFFQMIDLQVVMVFPGLYTAARLDEVFRTWPFEAERRILVGHWHVLATLSATTLLFLVADRLDVRGWMRQVLGRGVILGSDLVFTFGAL